MRRSEARDTGTGIDLAEVDRIVAHTGSGPEHALPVLQAIQSHFRYLPEAALRRVCEITSRRRTASSRT
jgi:NADH:ubiquinone oxidoreductase subunit E